MLSYTFDILTEFIRDNNTNGFKYFKEIMYGMTFLES